jgi:hypothetical protein
MSRQDKGFSLWSKLLAFCGVGMIGFCAVCGIGDRRFALGQHFAIEGLLRARFGEIDVVFGKVRIFEGMGFLGSLSQDRID